jgi:hypothetical protein
MVMAYFQEPVTLGTIEFLGRLYSVEKIVNYSTDKRQEIHLKAQNGEIHVMKYNPNERGKQGWRE